MNDKVIEASRLRLAQVRYFDSKRRASEIPPMRAYTFLVNVNGTYIKYKCKQHQYQ